MLDIFGGNIVDIAFFLVIFYFIFTNRGFINTAVEIVGFILSLSASYRIYPYLARFITTHLSITKGISQATSFFICWFVVETVFYLLVSIFLYPRIERLIKHQVNKLMGYGVGALQGAMLFLFFVSLVFALPVRGQVKQAILESRTGPFFVDFAQTSEKYVKNIFNDAISDTLNFMTVKPDSDSRVDLGFKVARSNLSIDSQSETTMLDLVNHERVQRGLKSLSPDPALQAVARAYATQMMENGFFSHVSAVDGSSPSKRVDRAGIEYLVVGENLAYAPDVYLAHQGLMNSPGHRANILGADYGRAGIGVIDGGVYGRMFVQLFRN